MDQPKFEAVDTTVTGDQDVIPQTSPSSFTAPVQAAGTVSRWYIVAAVILGGLIGATAVYIATYGFNLTDIFGPGGVGRAPLGNERPQSTLFNYDSVPVQIVPDLSGTVAEPQEPGYTLRHDPTDYSNLYDTLMPQAGVEWLDVPKPLGDIGLLVLPADNGWWTSIQLDYFQIGSVQGEPIVYVEVPCDGMCGYNDYITFVGNPDQRVRYIVNNSTYSYDDNYYHFAFPPYVEVDRDFSLTAFSVATYTLGPVTLTSGANGLFGRSGIASFFANSLYNQAQRGEGIDVTTELVAKTPHGPLFRSYVNFGEYQTADMSYAIRLPGGLMAPFEYALPFMGDDRVPKITWNDGTANATMYRLDGLGSCGGGGPEVYLGAFAESDLQPAGRTSSGETVYNLVNKNHPLIQRVFAATQGNVYEYNQATGEQRTYSITADEFISARGVLIYVDPLGYQNVLTNAKFGPQAECAKPVVYLYPEATTTVSVAVDAHVTKSEPAYGNGWVATASPDGTLIVNGATYRSLFWDGYGNGAYPAITEGFTVPTSDAMAVMARHLSYMGFTQAEIQDFVTFWQPHLPTTPYTEFHWLQTREMERLAKLAITPRPDTLLRAFIEFTGVASPTPLVPQVLQHVEREGFVASEWGGLLRK